MKQDLRISLNLITASRRDDCERLGSLCYYLINDFLLNVLSLEELYFSNITREGVLSRHYPQLCGV